MTNESTSVGVPTPGQLVHVRQRAYLVERVEEKRSPEESSIVHLSCIDDDNQGAELSVLWDRELDRRILDAANWTSLSEKGFDDPSIFAAYFHTLRWNCVTATDPKLFQAPFRAGIKIEAYQLEPLRRAIMMPRVNLFIADDVGLGKTIEAGLIVRELMLRKKAKYIVVVAPPSMVPQWYSELEDRFGLTFQVFDRDYVSRMRQERGYRVNPWLTHSRFLVSNRLLIDEEYTGPLRAALEAQDGGAVLVMDEAHHAAPSSGTKYAIDSKITKSIRNLAPRFDHRLFLSATPHNGHSNSFSALLEILDPFRFERGGEVDKKNLKQVLIRRLKDDLRKLHGGFPVRIVEPVIIDGLDDESHELKLPKLLDEYITLRLERLADAPKSKRMPSQLLACGLQQRLLSSTEAFAKTLSRHRKGVERLIADQSSDERSLSEKQLSLLSGGVGSDDDRASLPEKENEAEVERQIDSATAASSFSVSDREVALLNEMTEIAETFRGQPDAKILRLVDWIRENMCPNLPEKPTSSSVDAAWNEKRVIIFTEWDDTKRYIHEQLKVLVHPTDRGDERIAVYHGPTPPDKREEIKREFNKDPNESPLRILIATDAAREGLNLQSHCYNLFHFDIPWNPSRMEQRNGRIDRKLQPSPEVYCRYFQFAQRPEDRILEKIISKSEVIRKELGSMTSIIDEQISKVMKAGISRKSMSAQLGFFDEIEQEKSVQEQKKAIVDELEVARDRQESLETEIDNLRDQLETSSNWINFNKLHFKDAISAALHIQGAPSLTASGTKEENNSFEFPRIDRLDGAARSWADTMDSLRAPRKHNEKIHEWRKNSPIRPIVFKDPGVLDDSVVHLHLEHKMTQRLLGRFLAQGFTAHDLARACLSQTEDTVPRVVLLGRIALFGPKAARLHEEIITITARWRPASDRKEPLKPYAKDAEQTTLSILEQALNTGGTSPPKEVMERLQESIVADVGELLPHLEKRGLTTQTLAEEALARRAEKEAKDIAEVLEQQKLRIKKYLGNYQRSLESFEGFITSEKNQVEANQLYWEKRLPEIDRDLEQEPKNIKAGYVVKARRLDPIGIVYLWPRSG